MQNVFKNYVKLSNEVDEKSTELPFFAMTLAPMQLEGKFYVQAINPIFWALQAKAPGKEVNRIRIAFENRDFVFYETENLDIGTVKAEAERAAQEKEQIMITAEIEAAKKAQEEQEEQNRFDEEVEYEEDYESQLNDHKYGE